MNHNTGGIIVVRKLALGFVVGFVVLAFGAASLVAGAPSARASSVQAWTSYFGDSKQTTNVSAVEKTTDGYLSGGWYWVGVPEMSDAHFFITKVDEGGHRVWYQAYGRDGLNRLYDMVSTPDGGLVAVGETTSTDERLDGVDPGGFVARFNSQGALVWIKSAGESVQRIWRSQDGAYFVTGSASLHQVQISKIAATGETLWTKLSGADGEGYGDVVPTADGGALVPYGSRAGSGALRFSAAGDEGDGFPLPACSNSIEASRDGALIVLADLPVWTNDGWLANCDSNVTVMTKVDLQSGGVLGEARITGFQCYELVSTGAGDFTAACGEYAIKFDADLQTAWQRHLAGADHGDYYDTIAVASDGGYVLGGYHDVGTHFAALAKISATGESVPAIISNEIVPATPVINDRTPVTDQKLSVNADGWTPVGVTLRQQWYRRSASGRIKAIPNATADAYQVRAGDVGYTLRVKVTGSSSGLRSVSRFSAWTSKVAKAPFLTAPTPTVDGVARVGMPLTVVPGIWEPAVKLKYRWYRVVPSGKSSAIKKATKSTYKLTASDKGKRLKVRVTGYRAGYLTTTRYSAVTEAVLPGMAGATPKISGVLRVDQELTANEQIWSPAEATFSYQWYARSRSGKVFKIAGATSRRYQVEGRYAGDKVKVAVTGHAADYASVTKTSGYTSTISKATFSTTHIPVITGTAQVGKTLTVTEGDWQPTPTFSYGWYRSGAAITGATKASYTLVGKDKSKTITVKVTARRTGFVSVSTTSAATAAVLA